MKRRNADCGKLRRPLKRSKITEGIYGSTFMYVKFVLVWALVLLADFLLAFRFEYLWPFWLLLRSVYDSFKYQGLAFSVFFMCVAITSDVVCYLFIPVQWLFFAASTYVWVQYVWHTERGICLPTVSLWLLFVYIEASMRLREFKSLPFQLDLCRPFAAHCIGYPVVTLGFGFKSYVSYRMRVRKQKDVQNENDFYLQLLQQALPSDQQTNSEKQKALPSKSQEEVISNGVAPSNTQTSNTNSTNTSTTTTSSSTTSSSNKKSNNKEVDKENNKKSANNATMIEDYQFMEQNPPPKKHNVNDYDEDENYKNEQHAKSYKANGVAKNTTTKLNSQKDNANKKGKNINSKDSPTTTYTNNKDDALQRLESDVKRLKIDLQSSRNTEQELRSQINNLLVGDKSQKSELYQLRQDNESLQTKLHNLVTSRQTDKKNLAAMERKLAEERKLRTASDQQLLTERNAKKAEDAAAARAIAAAAARGECTDTCKLRRSQIESELKQIRRDFKLREDQIRQLERERQSLRQYKDAQNETEVLMSALSAMQDKNTHLENSLSAETRVKLDLFSALGEAKRQIEIQQGMLLQKDDSIADLKSKMAEVLALMPTGYTSHASPDSSQHFSGKFTPASSPPPPPPPHDDDVLSKSSLNPNATDYTPKSQ